MKYDLTDVKRYANDILIHHMISPRIRQLGTSTDPKQSNWWYFKKNLELTQNNNNPGLVTLAAHAQRLIDAIKYLQSKRKISSSRQVFIDDNVCYLIQLANKIIPDNSISEPKQNSSPQEYTHSGHGTSDLLHEVREKNQADQAQIASIKHNLIEAGKGIINTGKDLVMQRDPEVTLLLSNDVFKKLEAYQTFLTKDSRTHSFFCMDFTVYNKANVLKELLKTLKKQTSMEAISTVLDEFYGSEAYKTLNKGQNITTRVFGLKTTTIKLLDELKHYAEDKSAPRARQVRW